MRAVPLLCAVALLSLSSACATWVKRGDGFPDERPAPALLASLEVAVEQKASGPDLVDLFQNNSVRDFGDTAYSLLADALREEGLELFLEKERAEAFEQLMQTTDNRLTAFTGRWQHPETAAVSLTQFRSFFFAGTEDARDKVKEVSRGHERELYTFVSMTVLEDVGLACGGLMLWGAPKLALDVIAIDGEGRTVYDARVVGEGHGSPFLVDRSPDNLRVALKDALRQLAALEEKPLE